MALVVVVVVMGGVGFLPLFGGPGYEHTLATGLVVPAAAAIATALDVSRGRRSVLAGLGRGVLAGLALAAASLATALLHTLRVGLCELWGALLFFALAAGAGSVMGGAWGAFAGEWAGYFVRAGRLSRRRLWAVIFALAGPLASVAVGVWRFYTSPMIFAFDPFVGYFSGTIYDTVIDPGAALVTYRLGSLATLVAFALFASVTARDGAGYHVDLRPRPALARSVLGAVAAAASFGVFLAGAELGHFSTAASIREALGAEKHGARCDVVYPSATRESTADLLVKDCDEELQAVEARLGARGPERVRAFFFRDAEQKKRLMGAAHTYIAKPWRKEVYLQLASYPHPVLAHELAHVVAGTFARGPFRVAGSLFGLVPNPGLIEGVAVAAAPGDDALTDAQWARAMKELGILPPMSHVFSFGFLGDASAKSYTLAGAFVTWIGDTFGMQTVRAWYGGADVTALTHESWASLDRRFEQYVASKALAPEALAIAKARFERPGIFGRRCPHVVDALRREAAECRDAQRWAKALSLYDAAIEEDGVDYRSRAARAEVLRRHVDPHEGASQLEALARDEQAPRPIRDRAEEALADADFIDGAYERAATRYEALAARTLDEDRARTLEIKARAARDADARPAVQALLLGDATHPPDVYVAGVRLGAWRQKTGSPLAGYLIGRNLLNHGRYEAGAAALDAVLASGSKASPRVVREAVRQRAIAACALGDAGALARMRARVEGPDDPFDAASHGRRAATLRLIARCARAPGR